MNIGELKQLLLGQNEEVLSPNISEIINSVMTLYEKGVEVGMKIGGQIKVDQACEWLDKNKHFHKELSFGGVSTNWNKFIREFRKDMGE
jgi:hypothetical protein